MTALPSRTRLHNFYRNTLRKERNGVDTNFIAPTRQGQLTAKKRVSGTEPSY